MEKILVRLRQRTKIGEEERERGEVFEVNGDDAFFLALIADGHAKQLPNIPKYRARLSTLE